MNKDIKLLVMMLSLLLCLSAVALGQESGGSIEGTVKDAQGSVVPDVSVTIRTYTGPTTGATSTTGIGSGFNRTVTTDSNGFFRVLQVPPGYYIVSTAATAGFGAATYERVNVILGRATPLDILVTPGNASAVVNVSTTDVQLDTTASEVATSLSAQKLQMIPKGQDFTTALKAAPGTRPDTFAGGWTVDGATNADNKFVIDGQEVTNYRTAGINSNNQIPFTMVQELQVKSSGFEAEFGGAVGGVFNVVTKGGSNQFHGEFGTGFRSSKLDGNPRPTQQRFTTGSGATFAQTIEYINFPKPKYLVSTPTANFSGPIIKDRVWFFTSWSPTITEQTNDTTFFTNAPAATRVVNTAQGNGGYETYRTRVVNEYGFARIDAEPFHKLRLTATYLWNPVATKGLLGFGMYSFGGAPAQVDFGGTIGKLKGNDLYSKQGGRNNSNNATFQAVWSPLQNLVTSFRYSRGFLNERGNNYFVPPGNQYSCTAGNTPATSSGPAVTFPGACDQGYVSASTTQNVKDVAIRVNWEGDATFLFNGLGKHQLKGGFQHTGIFNDVSRAFSQIVFLAYGPTYRTNSTPFQWNSTAIPNPAAIGVGAIQRFGTVGKGSNLAKSIYVQDKWQPIDRLTLNLGVRFENEDVPSMNEFPAGFHFGWGKKIAPRLGFAYDLGGNGRTKLFGSYGTFFDRIKFNMAQGSFGGDFYRVDFFDLLPTSGPFTNFTTQSVVGNFSDPIGGSCPSSGFIGTGLSRCQIDFRVASNDPRNNVLVSGGIDPNAKAYQQREYTFGVEHQLSSNYLLRGRYTHKAVVHAIEDAGGWDPSGSEIYITGNPGEGLHADVLKAWGFKTPYFKPIHRYDAMEIVLEKRLSNHYYFNANYTLSRLYGNYSGLSNTDEVSGGLNGTARSSPATNRSFDHPYIGGTALGTPDAGLLATDRPHVFNIYGAYIFDWMGSKSNSTEFSVFQTVQSGTPQTTQVQFFTAAIYTKRGDLGRSPTFTQTDFGVTHRYRFGRDNRLTLVSNLNILNLFDQKTVLGLQFQKTNGAINFTPWPCATFPQYYNLLPGGLCSTGSGTTLKNAPGNYPALVNDYMAGKLKDQIDTYLLGTSTDKTRTLATYGLPNRYQGVRQVTFSFNLQF